MGSPAVEFLKWLKPYLVANSTKVITTDNVLLGESHEFLMKDDSEYPRFEIQNVANPARGYVTQRVRNKDFAFSIQGFIRRTIPEDETDDYTCDQDMFDVMDFAHETEGIIYNIHNLMQAGAVSIPKFVKLSGMDDAFMVLEIEPKISTFVLNFTAEFSFKDNDKG